MISHINNISYKKFHSIVYILGTIFFFVFTIFDGPILQDDSFSYINMDGYREPIYVLFLAFCRMIFPWGELGYLYIVALIQGILMAFCISCLATYISKEFGLSNINSLVVYAFPYVVLLLFRFVAGEPGDQIMYSSVILTEGVTVALHLLFVRYGFEYLRYQTTKSMIYSILLSFVGISIRKQMIVWLLILLLIILWVNRKESITKGIVKSIAVAGLVIVMSLLLDRTYNYFENGKFVGHVNDNRFIATMIFYTSESSDVKYIEDEELSQLYMEIHESCDALGLLKPQKESGMRWFDRSFHFVNSYDQIQLDTMYPIIREKLPELQFAEEINNSEQRLDAVVGYYIDRCLVNHLPRMISIYADNVLTGFVTSVTQRNRVLSWGALFLYVGYVFGIFTLVRHGKKNGYSSEIKGILSWSIFVLLSISVNVCTVAMVIFCQTRYMIYNMSLFYIAFWLMIQYWLKVWIRNVVQKRSRML